MERNSWATYQDISDALPTVNAGSTPARLDQPPTTARISPHELGPYHERSERFRFFARIVETLRALPRGSKDLVCSERINILLVFVPIGITVGLLEVDPIVDFVLNALAIIPLAVVISTATENVASHLGDTFGALLNVTVGNTAELMIFFVALAKNQIRIVQASLLGSVLANLLLVLGTAFLVGGLRFANQLRDKPAAHMSVGLLDFGLLVSFFPVAFVVALRDVSTAQMKQQVLEISRGTSVGLIVIYLLYLVFQMKEQSSKDETEESSDVDEVEPLAMATLPNNTSRIGAAWSRLVWLRGMKEPDSRGKYQAAPQLDNAVSASLLRSASLDDLGATIHGTEDTKARTAHRSHSAGAKASHGHHTPHDSMESRSWRDAISIDTRQGHAEAESYGSYNDHFSTARPAHVGLPPSPPSTPPTPASRRSSCSHHRGLLSVSESGNAGSFAGTDDLHRARSPRRGFDRTFDRRNTLAELYDYRRHRMEQSQTPLPIAILVLVIATALVSAATEHAVDAIPPIVESWGVSQIFLGFIVLPSIGNASEHIIAAKMASNNKMVLAKKVAVESAAQIVLLIMPAVILIGWIKGLEMSMKFDIYEIACIVMTSLVASILVCRGKGDWKQGMLLHGIFLIVSLGAVLYPTTAQLYGQR